MSDLFAKMLKEEKAKEQHKNRTVLNYFKIPTISLNNERYESLKNLIGQAKRPMVLSIHHPNGTGGHAVCLIPKRDGSGFTFYDPSGYTINELVEMGYRRCNLLELQQALNFDDSGQHNIQKQTGDTDLCYKWCIERIIMQELTNEEFPRAVKMIADKHTHGDQLVFVSKNISELATKIEYGGLDENIQKWRAEYVLARPETNPLLEKGGNILIAQQSFIDKTKKDFEELKLLGELARKFSNQTITEEEKALMFSLTEKMRQDEQQVLLGRGVGGGP